MTIHEYLDFKDKRLNIKAKISDCDTSTESGRLKKEKLTEELNQLEKDIVQAESEANVGGYLDLIKRRTRLQQLIGSWKYYKKDTSHLEEQLSNLLSKIEELETPNNSVLVNCENHNCNFESPNPIYISSPVTISGPLNIVHQPNQNEVKQSKEPTYYIINLAWSSQVYAREMNLIIDFLNTTNYDEVYKENTERDEHIYKWKYTYDTNEEQIQVKAIKSCVTHLLESLKSNYNMISDAEIYGRIQNY